MDAPSALTDGKSRNFSNGQSHKSLICGTVIIFLI